MDLGVEILPVGPRKWQLHFQINLALTGGKKWRKSKFGAPQEAPGAVGWEQAAVMCSGIQEPPSGTGSEPRWSWIIFKVPSIPIQSGISGILSCPLPCCPGNSCSSSLSCPPPSPNPLLPFASPTSSVARGGNETLWIFGISTSQADSVTPFFTLKPQQVPPLWLSELSNE